MTELWNSNEEYSNGKTYKEYRSEQLRNYWNSEEEYKNGLTYKEYSIQYRNSDEYKEHMSKLVKKRFKDPEWLKKWSEIDSKFMKELWSNKDYREYMLKCREDSGAYEKISKSKKNEWKNLSEKEYLERCENISKGTNSVNKSNFGKKTKDLWKNEEYRNHMKLVHTKEYQIEHGTYKEMSEETKYKRKLKNFRYSQKKLIERIMKLEDLTYSSLWQGGGYTKLYNHRYLFKLCSVSFKFDKSLIKENFLQDYSDIDTQYLSDDLIPFKQFKKYLIRLVNNT